VQQGSACVSAGQQGDVAQLVEHLLCKQGVGGSSPLVSTTKPLLPRVLAVVSGGVTGRGSFATANRRISTSFGIRSRRSRRRAEYSLLEVSWMMGHSSIKVTADTYSHLFDEDTPEKQHRMDAMQEAAMNLQRRRRRRAPR
jgi:hypothetical protein